MGYFSGKVKDSVEISLRLNTSGIIWPKNSENTWMDLAGRQVVPPLNRGVSFWQKEGPGTRKRALA
jgi:hypothetical protein